MLADHFAIYETKAAQEAEAFELAQSTYRIRNNGSVIPYAEGESREVLERISGLITSLGSKILNRKMDGIVGNISITASDRAKSILQGYNLRGLIKNLARDAVIKGSAGVAISTRDGDSYVSRLGGFIAPVTAEDDVDRVLSIFQAQQDAKGKWIVRIYQDNLVQEWRGVTKLRDILSSRPTETTTGFDSVAFLVVSQTDDSGLPLGEMEQLAPILKGIMAVEARIHRTSELYGFPVPVIKGTVQQRPAHSPANAIITSEGGDVKYLLPADMNNLIQQKKDLVANLDDVAILPVSSVLGYEPPSGEALKEASTAFNTNISHYAKLLSELVSDAFSAFIGEDVQILVSANRIHNREQELTDAITHLEKGLLPISYVIRMLKAYYEDLSDEEAEEVIRTYKEKTDIITPESLGLI